MTDMMNLDRLIVIHAGEKVINFELDKIGSDDME